jgi:uncharacterized protein (DUF885 family)
VDPGHERDGGSVDDAARLDDLADEALRGQLGWAPLYASQIGYPEYAGALPDVSVEGEERRRQELESLQEKAARLDPKALDPQRQITLQVLQRTVSDALVGLAAEAPSYTVSPLPHTGPAATVMVAFPKLPLRTPEEAQGYLERLHGVPRWLADAARRIDEGRAAGRLPVRRLVAAAAEQLAGYLATDLAADPLVRVDGEVAAADWRQQVADAVRDQVRPALARCHDHLVGEVLPTARPDSTPGLAHLPGGTELYQRLASSHTSTDHSADDLHRIGVELVAELTEEMRRRGGQALGTSDFAEIATRLRTDSVLFFDSAEEMLTVAKDALARAEEASPRWLGIVPKVGCEVLEQSVHEAENGNLGYYQWASRDGSRPGRYWLNTYRPTTRPRFELQGLTFHESVPGHHTQLALLWELPDLCDFRRHARATAFTEGWALYTERLADEMGLYTDEVSRLGMVSFDFWRACRLVVDTGMHAHGWSRDQAVAYMLDHSALMPKNVENEIDRYIAWPGQALGYMVGRLEITRLRAEASRRLGSGFVLPDFHRAVLSNGNLPLSVLADVVDDWTSARV